MLPCCKKESSLHLTSILVGQSTSTVWLSLPSLSDSSCGSPGSIPMESLVSFLSVAHSWKYMHKIIIIYYFTAWMFSQKITTALQIMLRCWNHLATTCYHTWCAPCRTWSRNGVGSTCSSNSCRMIYCSHVLGNTVNNFCFNQHHIIAIIFANYNLTQGRLWSFSARVTRCSMKAASVLQPVVRLTCCHHLCRVLGIHTRTCRCCLGFSIPWGLPAPCLWPPMTGVQLCIFSLAMNVNTDRCWRHYELTRWFLGAQEINAWSNYGTNRGHALSCDSIPLIVIS